LVFGLEAQFDDLVLASGQSRLCFDPTLEILQVLKALSDDGVAASRKFVSHLDLAPAVAVLRETVLTTSVTCIIGVKRSKNELNFFTDYMLFRSIPPPLLKLSPYTLAGFDFTNRRIQYSWWQAVTKH
jgi:hypothetical protein